MKHPENRRLIAVAFLIAGVILNYIVVRRKFGRRTITGSEAFKTFEAAWITKLAERIASVVAKLFILIAVVMFVLSFA